MNGQVYIPGPDERLDIERLARTRQQESETAALDAILQTAIAAVRALNFPAGWPNMQHDQASTIDALEQLRPNRDVEIEDDVTAAERAFDERQQGNDARRGW